MVGGEPVVGGTSATPARVAVVGASGFVGGELIRLLDAHQQVVLGATTAETSVGSTLRALHPVLCGERMDNSSLGERVVGATDPRVLAEHDVVFLALPHGRSAELVDQIESINPGVVIVDCSADHRLKSEADWNTYYEGAHQAPWTYGLAELPDARSHLKEATRIAAPGCFVTAATLALMPLVANDLIEPDLVVVAASGHTGAGRNSELAATIVGEPMSAAVYNAGGMHRHTPEIRQNLQQLTDAEVSVSFTPMILPIDRGIIATCSATATTRASDAALRAAFDRTYEDEAFVTLLPEGTWPSTGEVRGTNRVHLQVSLDAAANRVVSVAALDNLTKGAAGSAIQAMNIALGLAETAGLQSEDGR